MGERKGQNKYYPPDFDWRSHNTLNRYHGVHALRERGKLAHVGIITIRFEMPFNVWCLGCNNHIGMSVRYNAEKKKVGMYYTTPIYEFRMKCHLCDNYFTIRTDPKNFDYELVEGVRRQEIRFDPSTIDNLAPVDRTMNLKLASDAMFKAEHSTDDKQKLAGDEQQINKLEWIQSRLYDDFGANSALRSVFRSDRKTLNERRAKDADTQKRLSTEVVLLPDNAEDAVAAKRMALSKHMTVGKIEESELTKEKLMSRPMRFDREQQPSCSKTLPFAAKSIESPEKMMSGGSNHRQILFQKLREKSMENVLETQKWNGSGQRIGGDNKNTRAKLSGVRTKLKVNNEGNEKSASNEGKEASSDVLLIGTSKNNKNGEESAPLSAHSLPGISVYNYENGNSSSSENDN